MKLKNMEISLNSWGPSAGKYTGKISYEGEHGTTELQLSTDISHALLGFIGPVITKCALKTSQQLEADLKQSITEATQPLIEAAT